MAILIFAFCTNQAPSIDDLNAGWTAYRLSSEKINFSTDMELKVNGKPKSISHVTYKKLGDNRLCFVITKDLLNNGTGAETHEVNCSNSKYSFSLTRGRADKPWILIGIGKTGDKNVSNIENEINESSLHLLSPISVRSVIRYQLDTMVKHNKINIKDIQDIADVVKCKFSYNNDKASQADYLRNGTLTFMKNNMYTLQEYSVNMQYRDGESKAHGIFKYREFNNKISYPILATITDETISKSGKITSIYSINYNYNMPVSIGDFFLQAYGISHSFDSKAVGLHDQFPFYTIFTIVGTLFMVTAILIKASKKYEHKST